ncbi:uncharacterized protein ARMOST_19562 [Armillaria ostoyae]|uniref:Uncharacterized protein n=1 Tax=Armillaria ostoyae TaxID=47428 RepID=A0A284S4X9_ARMOS|nr:uncharacterized protein ARMOST_19562 [Armillaria ostoyae]
MCLHIITQYTYTCGKVTTTESRVQCPQRQKYLSDKRAWLDGAAAPKCLCDGMPRKEKRRIEVGKPCKPGCQYIAFPESHRPYVSRSEARFQTWTSS